MKKIIALLILVILFTGCSLKNINNDDINKIIEDAISESNNDSFQVFNGYKVRIPQGFKIVGKNGNNFKIQTLSNNYYLYIDLISRYHKKEINYIYNNSLYLSKTLSYNDKDGYIEITRKDDKYFIKAEYNYAKIETLVDDSEIKQAAYNIIRILSSVEYNDKIINTLIGDNVLNYKEEEFSLFESTQQENYFMDYVEEYDNYKDDNTLVDEDVIKERG